ncbi:MAG: AAA family ATPase [Acutalibacter sp.]
MKHIVHIYGPCGSGTSTLGREIGRRLRFRFLDTDDFFWLPTDPPYTQKRPLEERLALLEEELDKPGDVVLSGALIPWGNPLIPRFTLVVRLEAETQLRLERLKARERADFGSRIEPGGDMYQDFLEFLEYARGYDTGGLNMRSRARHDAWEKLLPCPVLHLDGAAPLEETVEEVRRALERMEKQAPC